MCPVSGSTGLFCPGMIDMCLALGQRTFSSAWWDARDNVEGQKGQGQVILASLKYALTSQVPHGNRLWHQLTFCGSHCLPGEGHREIIGGSACPLVAPKYNCTLLAWVFTMWWKEGHTQLRVGAIVSLHPLWHIYTLYDISASFMTSLHPL